ncbi:MAG: SDR family NAD(P)-dependent oxidoreductase [Microthrixaceae bacterium]
MSEPRLQVLALEMVLRLPAAHRKDRRQVVRSLVERPRNRFGVASAELDDASEPKRAVLGFCAVSNSAAEVEDRLRAVEDLVWSRTEVEVLEVRRVAGALSYRAARDEPPTTPGEPMTDTPNPEAGSPGELFSVEGLSVVVTGGTSGIGRMIAGGFAAAGAEVLVTSRKPGAVESTVEELAGIAPGGSASVGGTTSDLSSEDGCREFADWVAADRDRLDVLVNSRVPPGACHSWSTTRPRGTGCWTSTCRGCSTPRSSSCRFCGPRVPPRHRRG